MRVAWYIWCERYSMQKSLDKSEWEGQRGEKLNLESQKYGPDVSDRR